LKRDELSWLAESMLTDANIKKVEQLSGIAAELEMSLPVLGVAWCLKNENVSSVILGASRAEQLVENLQAVDLYHRLTADVMDRIEAILVNRPKAPAF
jgi:aryl-alcohol dehydrogenase-like predicted oxidoreductase